MTSPFHQAPGIQKYGDVVFEWRSLLNTPCYGFNGPNACYSSTCSHNPSLSESEKQLTTKKSKLLLKLNYNGRKASSSERASDHITKSSLASHLTVQMNVYNHYNGYGDFEQQFNRGDFYYDNSTSRVCNGTNLPLQGTNDTNQLYESSFYYSNHQSVETNFECNTMNISHDLVTKKYAFNPLSKPFHPMKTCSSSSESSCDSSMTEKSETSTELPEEPTKIPSKIPSKDFVCILCPEKFATLDELQYHIRNKAQSPFECVTCGVTCESNYLLQRHLINHRRIIAFTCRGCHKKFRSLNRMRKHFDICRFKLHILV